MKIRQICTIEGKGMTNYSSSVIVYGDSLLMSSMLVALQEHTGLNLIQVTPNAPLAQETLAAMYAGILICDLSHYDAQMMADFIFTHPNVTVIGLHFEEDRAVTLVSQEHPLQATSGLLQIIERELAAREGRGSSRGEGL